MRTGDTIAAISTPAGPGGIGIIRISGPDALSIAASVFKHAGRGPLGAGERNGWRARFGHVVSADGEVIDEAILLVMPAPRSYTRENVAEISCHGGTAVAARVLQVVLAAGARHAEPGEFTKRAFLNGRIDLGQAEAVLEMINAVTERARKAASAFLAEQRGGYVLGLKAEIVDLMTQIEASLDFPEDDVPDMETISVGRKAAEIAERLEKACSDAAISRVLWKGTSVAIVGRPNVGKSRLLNALLREERAIVSETPGTTRDVVSEVANIRGIPIRLVDTAGMRESDDPIEKIGVERARAALAQADIVLAVVDTSDALSPADAEIITLCAPAVSVVVANKCDLPAAVGPDEIARIAGGRGVVRTSARTGEGVDELEAAIERLALASAAEGRGAETLTDRRIDCLRRAAAHMREVERGALGGMPPDMLSIDLRSAVDAVGELTGETTREDVIDKIFAQFCVGK